MQVKLLPLLANVCISHLPLSTGWWWSCHILHCLVDVSLNWLLLRRQSLLNKRPCIHPCRLWGPKAARENIFAWWRSEGYFWADLSCYDKTAETWMYLSWIFTQCSLLSSGICIILVHLLIKFKLHFLPESVAVVSLGKFLSRKHADWRRHPWYSPFIFKPFVFPQNYFCLVMSQLKG